MLKDMAIVFKNTNSGLSISIILVGALLAASTGIVGATVVTMGLMSLPVMLRQGYEKDFSAGLVASTEHSVKSFHPQLHSSYSVMLCQMLIKGRKIIWESFHKKLFQ